MLSAIQEPSAELLATFRLFLNDFVEMNRLLKLEEAPSGHLALALRLACDEYNGTPPLISGDIISPDDYPVTTLLFHGAAITVFRMMGLMHLRNQLTYNDGGIQVSINEKEGQYRQWAQEYISEYKKMLSDYKVAKNYEGAFGSSSSEYSLSRYVW